MKNEKLLDRLRAQFPVEAPESEKNDQLDYHLILLLSKIDPYDPMCRLSVQTLRELNLPALLPYIKVWLTEPSIPYKKLAHLLSGADWVIHALEQAMREGLEETARWACSVLIVLLLNVKVADTFSRMSNGAAYDRCCRDFANGLPTLVRCHIERDRLAIELADMEKRFESCKSEFNALHAQFQKRQNSGKLDPLMAELKAAAGSKAPLSPKALALRNELHWLHSMKRSLNEMQTACNTRREALKSLDQEHRRHHERQFHCPVNTDHDTWSRYLSLLDGSIDKAAQNLRDFDVHLDPLEQKLQPHNPVI